MLCERTAAEQYRLHPSPAAAVACVFRADAHVKSGRVILPLIVRRICRYDCGGKQGETGTSKGRGEPFRSWRGPGPGHVPCSNTVVLLLCPLLGSARLTAFHLPSRARLASPFLLLSSRVAWRPRIRQMSRKGEHASTNLSTRPTPMSTMVIVIRILIPGTRRRWWP